MHELQRGTGLASVVGKPQTTPKSRPIMHEPKPFTSPAPRTAATPEPRAAGVPHPIGDAGKAAGAGVGAASGAAAGAAIGAFAGPPGVVAGAIIGAAAGAATGAALGSDHDAEDEDKKLDEEIGVTSGNLGAASPNAPPATRGTYSGASAGAGTAGLDDSAPDEGPIPHGE
jgi:phage tail tape-measure protein